METEQECCQNTCGFYLGTTCPKCNKPFRSVIQEPKQETTLEEAGLKHCDILDKFPALINPLFSFKEGAKWQQENTNINALNFEIEALKKEIKVLKHQQEQDKKMYSEEEMLKMLHKFGFDYTYNYKGEKTIYKWIPEWFEEKDFVVILKPVSDTLMIVTAFYVEELKKDDFEWDYKTYRESL